TCRSCVETPVERGAWASGAVVIAVAVPPSSDASAARGWASLFMVSLERADLRRNRPDRVRTQVHGLVLEAVAFAEPERVLHPLGVVAAVRRDRIVDRALVVVDGVGGAAFVTRRRREHRR